MSYDLEMLSKGRYSGVNECFNSSINKMCPKRIKMSTPQHEARVHSAKNDWNDKHGVDEYDDWRHNCCRQYGIL